MDIQTIQNRIEDAAAALRMFQMLWDDAAEGNGGAPAPSVASHALELVADSLTDTAEALEKLRHESRP
jgi:hypothetical protein